MTPPETQSQQVSAAEILFQQGKYEEAARALRKVGPHLKEREDAQVGARRAMLEAYKQAGRKALYPLPQEREFPGPNCLTQTWG